MTLSSRRSAPAHEPEAMPGEPIPADGLRNIKQVPHAEEGARQEHESQSADDKCCDQPLAPLLADNASGVPCLSSWLKCGDHTCALLLSSHLGR